MGNDWRRHGNGKSFDEHTRYHKHTADRDKLFKIIKMLYGLMGLQFSEEAEPMDADPAVLDYFLFSLTADFGKVMQDIIADDN